MKLMWLARLRDKNQVAAVATSTATEGAAQSAAAPPQEEASAIANRHSSLITETRPLPRPAIRWMAAGRIALRTFDFAADAEAVCSFQEETYTLNFPEFRYTESFAMAFRHDLRRAALDPQHGLFVLDEGGQIVGFLWLVICQNTWTGERYGYINNIYIAPARRELRLGHELMRHSDEFFIQRGIKRTRLTVTASNIAASELYRRNGYTVTRWEMEKEL